MPVAALVVLVAEAVKKVAKVGSVENTPRKLFSVVELSTKLTIILLIDKLLKVSVAGAAGTGAVKLHWLLVAGRPAAVLPPSASEAVLPKVLVLAVCCVSRLAAVGPPVGLLMPSEYDMVVTVLVLLSAIVP